MVKKIKSLGGIPLYEFSDKTLLDILVAVSMELDKRRAPFNKKIMEMYLLKSLGDKNETS